MRLPVGRRVGRGVEAEVGVEVGEGLTVALGSTVVDTESQSFAPLRFVRAEAEILQVDEGLLRPLHVFAEQYCWHVKRLLDRSSVLIRNW